MRINLKEWRRSSWTSTRPLTRHSTSSSTAPSDWILRLPTKCSSKSGLSSIPLFNFPTRIPSSSSTVSTRQLRKHTSLVIPTTRIWFLAMTLPEISGQERRFHTTLLCSHIPLLLVSPTVTFWSRVDLTLALPMSQDRCSCTTLTVKTARRKHRLTRIDTLILWRTKVTSCMRLVEDL